MVFIRRCKICYGSVGRQIPRFDKLCLLPNSDAIFICNLSACDRVFEENIYACHRCASCGALVRVQEKAAQDCRLVGVDSLSPEDYYNPPKKRVKRIPWSTLGQQNPETTP